MSTTLVGVAGSQIVSQVRSFIAKNVIERWAENRARNFINALVDAVREERDYDASEDDVNRLLEKLVENENNSEALFDAYRRVCLARSRDIGPRIIGLLTATLLLEVRRPTTVESSILDIAENLTDDELQAIVKTVKQWVDQSTVASSNAKQEGGELHFRKSETIIAQLGHGTSTGGVLVEVLGSWGEKLRTYGMLSERVQDQVLKKAGPVSLSGTEFGPDRLVTHILIFRRGYQELVDLIDRASHAVDAEASR